MVTGHAAVVLPALLVLLAFAAAGPAADFYVAPSGSDDAPGTKDRPFATLARARQAVRRLLQAGLTKDVTVEIAGGRYALAGPVAFGPGDSGTQDHSITYAAAAGERPVFRGGRRIGGWTRGAAGVWQATVPAVGAGAWQFNELFVAGRRAVRARSPNQGWFRVIQAGPDNRTRFQFRAGDLGRYEELPRAEIVFLHDWSISRVGIREVDEKDRWVTLADPIGSAAAHYKITHFEPHPRYFVENARELLDAPGEWHLDRRTGRLSYRPRKGEDLSSAEVIAPAAERLLEVRGDAKAGRPVRNLRFVGLSFEHCAFPRPPGGYAAGQAGFYDDRSKGKGRFMRLRMPAAVEFEAAVGCALEDCRIARVGGAGLSLRRGCRDCRVVGCEIADAGGNGIMIGETSQAKTDMAGGNAVRNCYVHDCGASFFGCVGVWVGITDGSVVARCEICRLPYTGVSVGWQWNTKPTPCANNRVESNHIHHVMQVLSDGGGIYTLGRQQGTVLSGNVIHDVPVNAGRAESNGMFIDEGSSLLRIEGNTIYAVARSPLRFHKATTNTIRTNTLAVAGRTPPFRFNACRRESMTFADNQVLKASSPGAKKLAEAIAKAGPEPKYRRRFLK